MRNLLLLVTIGNVVRMITTIILSGGSLYWIIYHTSSVDRYISQGQVGFLLMVVIISNISHLLFFDSEEFNYYFERNIKY